MKKARVSQLIFEDYNRKLVQIKINVTYLLFSVCNFLLKEKYQAMAAVSESKKTM